MKKKNNKISIHLTAYDHTHVTDIAGCSQELIHIRPENVTYTYQQNT